MEKDTSKIVEELEHFPDFRTFYAENKAYMVSGNLSSLLLQLLESKGLKKSQVIKKAEQLQYFAVILLSTAI